ncbi:hypothetical protein H8E50_01205, partial [bacterium]|nr:hypothetical protein [bacterium]
LIRGSITENKVIADFEILSGACASYEGTLSLLLMSNATSPEVISPSAVGSGDWTNYVLPYGLLSANTSSVTSPFITDGDRNTGVVLYGKESQGRNGPRLNAPFVRFDFNVGFDAEALVFNITSSSANGVFQGSLIFNMYSQNNLFQDIRLAHMVDGIDTFSFVFSKSGNTLLGNNFDLTIDEFIDGNGIFTIIIYGPYAVSVAGGNLPIIYVNEVNLEVYR